MSKTVEASAEEVDLLLLLHHLPVDIRIEILVRLPVKSLLRFKSVCKNWYHLIKSPSFVSRHLHRPTADGVSPVLFIRKDNTFLSLLRDNTLSVAADYEVPPPVKNYLWEGPEIVGSCNGLVVVTSSWQRIDKFILWNPATRMSKRLPKPLLTAKTRNEDLDLDLFYGFWSTPGTQMDHSLLRIVQFLGKGNDHRYYDTKIYSQATDSWQEIDAEFPTECILRSPSGDCGEEAVVVNGNLHWSAYYGGGNREDTIVAFDTKTEMFQNIPIPGGFKQCYISLVVYQKTCLGLAMIPRKDDDDDDGGGGFNDVIDVWVMKEYGVHESWTKLFSVECFIHSELRVQGCWRNGEIIIYGGSDKLVLYAPNTRLFRDFPIDGYPCNLTYQESLLSVEAWDAAY